jgi:hypothetical protein
MFSLGLLPPQEISLLCRESTAQEHARESEFNIDFSDNSIIIQQMTQLLLSRITRASDELVKIQLTATADIAFLAAGCCLQLVRLGLQRALSVFSLGYTKSVEYKRDCGPLRLASRRSTKGA